MAYFPDLSPYIYRKQGAIHRTLNVGWLDAAEPYARGDVPSEFIDRLWQFCTFVLMPTRGYHICNFCKKRQLGPLVVTYENRALRLGTAEIRVIGRKGILYASPNLIFHYVTEHNYRPPEEYVRAVLTGPAVDSSKFLELVKELPGADSA